jgi:hypothetical protein
MKIFGKSFTPADMRRVIWTAGQAAFGSAVVAYPVLLATLKSDKKAAAITFLVTVGGAFAAAAASAFKNWFLADNSPIK